MIHLQTFAYFIKGDTLWPYNGRSGGIKLHKTISNDF